MEEMRQKVIDLLKLEKSCIDQMMYDAGDIGELFDRLIREVGEIK